MHDYVILSDWTKSPLNLKKAAAKAANPTSTACTERKMDACLGPVVVGPNTLLKHGSKTSSFLGFPSTRQGLDVRVRHVATNPSAKASNNLADRSAWAGGEPSPQLVPASPPGLPGLSRAPETLRGRGLSWSCSSCSCSFASCCCAP